MIMIIVIISFYTIDGRYYDGVVQTCRKQCMKYVSRSLIFLPDDGYGYRILERLRN